MHFSVSVMLLVTLFERTIMMANIGFCKNCKKMEKLSFLDTCKKCKGEIVVGTKISDSEWNNKTQAVKRFILIRNRRIG